MPYNRTGEHGCDGAFFPARGKSIRTGAKNDLCGPRQCLDRTAVACLEMLLGWPIQNIVGNLRRAFDGAPSAGVRSLRSRESMRWWSRSKRWPAAIRS